MSILQDRINYCKENKTDEIDLYGLGLTKIPTEINELVWLKSLNFSGNQISEIENLDNLVNLKVLNLSGNQISEIKNLEKLVNLTQLGFISTQISEIKNLENLVNLILLVLSDNQISEIKNLDNLVNLNWLDLSSNQISEIRNLDNLVNLNHLYLSYTQISEIRNLDNLVGLNFLSLGNNQISEIRNLDNLVNLNRLELSNNQISEIRNLDNLVNLNSLELSSNQISEIRNLDNLVNLNSLYLFNNQISEIRNLDNLVGLNFLSLGNNQISEIRNLDNLVNLNSLELSKNQISEIRNLDNLVNLNSLYLSNNQISEIRNLDNLVNLNSLYLSNNQISEIRNLDNLVNLNSLELSKNQISEIKNLEALNKLKKIDIGRNKIKELPRESLDNIKAIRGYLESLKESLLPNAYLKANIIGEGRIGKTQLFNHLQDKRYVPLANTTHGTSTCVYALDEQHKVTVWDFGGQSYHHGFHKVFIRRDDFNIVLWRNTDYAYWLGTARKFSPNAPLLMVQNIWETSDNPSDSDFTADKVIYPDSAQLALYKVGLGEIFSVNIKELHKKEGDTWKTQHAYFFQCLEKAMKEYVSISKTYSKVSKRWLEIKEKLDTEKSKNFKYFEKRAFKERYAIDISDNNFEALLYFLQFTGNILYLYDIPKLRNIVILHPTKFADWIYNKILDKEFKETSNGILDFDKLKIRIGPEKANIFLDLVKGFHLLFEEKGNPNHLVIPQFLPEQNHAFKKYLLELIPNTFSIRFTGFISESRIFQFISEFGKYAIDKTSYWRYGLLFTYDETKALVYYDEKKSEKTGEKIRTIHAHVEEKKGKMNVVKAIFDFFTLKEDLIHNADTLDPNLRSHRSLPNLVDLMNTQDWSGENLPPKERRVLQSILRSNIYRDDSFDNIEDGVLLSTNNGVNYIDIKKTLADNQDGLNMGFCVEKNKTIKLDYLTINILEMQNHKLPKVFISYSRKDLEFKNELRNHLSILERYGLLTAWDCEEIKPGEWDPQIQSKLEEADILVYMVSHNFMSSGYIMEQEVMKGLDLQRENPEKKIICVLVRECSWRQWGTLEQKRKEIIGEAEMFSNSMDLSKFQFLPYHQYKKGGVAFREEIIALEDWGRNDIASVNVAYTQIVEKIIGTLKSS